MPSFFKIYPLSFFFLACLYVFPWLSLCNTHCETILCLIIISILQAFLVALFQECEIKLTICKHIWSKLKHLHFCKSHQPSMWEQRHDHYCDNGCCTITKLIVPKQEDGDKFPQPDGHEAQSSVSQQEREKKSAAASGHPQKHKVNFKCCLTLNRQYRDYLGTVSNQNLRKTLIKWDWGTTQVTTNWLLRLVVTEKPGNSEKTDSESVPPTTKCRDRETHTKNVSLSQTKRKSVLRGENWPCLYGSESAKSSTRSCYKLLP